MTGNPENGFVITNKLKSGALNNENREITVTKVWEVGDATQYKKDIKVGLKVNGQPVGETKEIKANAANAKVTFTVAKYNAENKEIKYDAYEAAFENQGKFDTNKTGNMADGFTITNSIKGNDLNQTDNLEITVSKEWENNISGLNIPNELKVRITNSENPDGIDLILNPGNKWTATTDKLNKYNDNGNFITYTITEEPISGFKLKDGIDTTVKGTANVVGQTENVERTLVNVAENGENDGKIKIDIRKVDSADPTKGLGGAIFKITSLDANMIPNALFAKTVTSNVNGDIKNIKLPTEGIYKIEETKAPHGYIKGQDVIFGVKKGMTGRLEFSLYIDKDAQGNPLQQPEWKDIPTGETNIPTLTIKNTKIKNDDIFKIDDNGTPLSGARFDLYKRNTALLPDAYAIFAEVDNSEIPSENIDVTVQLYKKSGGEEAVAVGESQKLTTSCLNNILADDLIPNAGDKYYVTFSFSTRFTAESIVFDATRNTFVLKLVLNTAIAQPSQPDPNNTESNGAGKAETAQPAPSENNEIDNTGNNNNDQNNSDTNNTETTTVKSLPAFTAMPTETDTNTNTEESGSVAPTEDNAEAAPQDTKSGEAVTEDANKDVAENGNEAEKAEGQDASNNTEKDKAGNEADAQKDDSEQKRDETNKGQAQTPLVYATITKTSEMVELSGDYAKYQTTAIVSDGEGRITLPNLPDGSYYLLETAAPAGNGGHYDKEDRKIRFDIEDGRIVIPEGEAGEGSMWLTRKVTKAADGSEVSTYQIVNTWVPDPSGNDPYIPPLDDPSNQPPVTIDDSNTPLTNPDNVSDTTKQNSQTDDDEDVILDDDLEDDEVPLANAKKDDDDEDVDIDSDKAPLTGIPKTADKARHIGFYIASCAAGILLLLSSRFRKKED